MNKKTIKERTGMDCFFGAGGLVSQVIRDFEPRAEQTQMSGAVFNALNEQEHLIVEAGTGVGKSLAYLVPAALWAVKNKKKVIVATHTKALQAQLTKKDLPLVHSILEKQDLPFSYFLLMGSGNYLCLSRLARASKNSPELFEEDESPKLIQELAVWAQTALSGSRPEIPLTVPRSVWEEVCRDPEMCLRKKCRFKEKCFFNKDVAKAVKADIVVVNQHLFFAGMPLPRFDAVIFDEAHSLEDVAASYIGFSVTDRKVKRFLDDIYNHRSGKGLARRIGSASRDWLFEVQQAVNDAHFASGTLFQEIQEKLGLIGIKEGEPVKAKRVSKSGLVKNPLEAPLLAITVLMAQALEKCSSAEEEAEIKGHMARCMELAEKLKKFLACERRDQAYWVEAKRSKRSPFVALNMTPVDVSEIFRATVFGRNFTAILASATMAADGSFKMIKTRLGLDKSGELLLDSPFDYKKQVSFLVPSGIPDPSSPADYDAAVVRTCTEVVAAVKGGVFLLFTSWQMLNKVYNALASLDLPRPLFKQGEEQMPQQLLENFKHAGNGVLFGTDTFWQGVDVPGSALSCVVITRLPFVSHDTPLEQTRKEWMTAKGQNVFNDYSLPKAIVKFRQGFGRLIRTQTDTGSVVVLDPRIHTKQYGAKFIRSIPCCRRLNALGDLVEACP